MIPIIAAGCAFFAVLLAVAGARLRPGYASDSESRLAGLRSDLRMERSDAISVIRRARSSIPFMAGLLSGKWGDNVRLSLEQAGVQLRPGEWVLLRAAFVAIPFLACVAFFGVVIGGILGAIVAGVGFFAPSFYLRVRTTRRRSLIDGQLGEFLRLTSNALRSGSALLQAIESASRELQAPLKDELRRLSLDTGMGANTEIALRRFADRVDSYEVRSVVTAILIQRTTGGNLSEVLDKVAETIEERERISGEVRTFTAQQRLTGNILSLYPLVLAGFFSLIHPGMMSLLVTTSAGIVLLAIGVSLQLVGFLVIRRILDVDY